MDCYRLSSLNQEKLFCTEENKTHIDRFKIVLNEENIGLGKFHDIVITNKNMSVLRKFIYLKKLKIYILDLSYNQIESVEENVFENVNLIHSLLMRHNRIKSIENIISDISKITITLFNLDFSYNFIENLNFSFPFKYLRTLNLENNRIGFIQYDCFYNLSYLILLSLNSNPIYIKNNLFKTIHFLDMLEVFLERINGIEENTFNNITKLEFLSLTHSNLSKIDSNIENPQLLELKLDHNKIKYLKNSTFLHSKKLVNLFLSNNEIEFIEPYTFKKLDLATLDLSYNKLQVIHSKTFVNLKNLYHLNLQNNRLKLFEQKSFSNIFDYIMINIRFNMIDSISNQSIEGFHKLLIYLDFDKINRTNMAGLKEFSDLNIQSSSIKRIESYSFIDFKKLRVLDLGQISINFLEKYCFYGLSLKKLDLQLNDIKILNANTFFGLDCLDIILWSNNIISIDTNAFNGIKNLKVLNLCKNYLKSIEANVFRPLNNLSNLDLSLNLIEKLEAKNFAHLKNLVYLNLSSNRIKFLFEQSFENLENLQTLDLSYNYIEYIKSYYFMNLNMLKVLLIEHNRVFSIQKSSLYFLSRLEFLDLSKNRLSILNFNLPKTLKSLNVSSNEIVNSYIQLNELTQIDLSKNPIVNIDFIDYTLINYLNLHGIGISKINWTVDSLKIEYLNLSFNNINDLIFISNISTLKVLDLSFNRIEKIEKFFFHSFKRLTNVDLSNNFIKYIQADSFNFKSILFKLSLRNISSDLNLEISLSQLNENIKSDIDLSNNQLKSLVLNLKGFVSLNMSNSNLLYLNSSCINHLDISSTNKKDYFLNNLNFMFALITLKMKKLNISSLDPLFKVSMISTQLLILDLSENQIEFVYSYHFSYFKKINELDLSFNQIKYIQSSSFLNCEFLRWLNLEHNQLLSIDFVLVFGYVEGLKINDNKISNFEVDKISSSFSQMQFVDFSNNKFESLDFLDKLFNMKFDFKSRLKTLNFSNNFLVKVTNKIFPNLRYLTHLDLKYNLINKIENDSFKYNTFLEHLDLSDNKLIELDENLFHGLDRIKFISLKNNRILYLAERLFYNLTNLQVLELSNNKLKHLSKNLFTSLIDLSDFFIDRNENLTFEIHIFSSMRKIRNIIVDYGIAKSEINKKAFVHSLKFEPVHSLKEVVYYKAINLIYKEPIIDCELTLAYLKHRININILTDEQIEKFLIKCKSGFYA